MRQKPLYRGRLLQSVTVPQVDDTAPTEGSRKRSADIAELDKGQSLDIVEKRADGTLVAISPIDPEKFIIIAEEFVELYNEAIGIWQTVAGFFKRVGKAFANLWSTFTGKRKP